MTATHHGKPPNTSAPATTTPTNAIGHHRPGTLSRSANKGGWIGASAGITTRVAQTPPRAVCCGDPAAREGVPHARGPVHHPGCARWAAVRPRNPEALRLVRRLRPGGHRGLLRVGGSPPRPHDGND